MKPAASFTILCCVIMGTACYPSVSKVVQRSNPSKVTFHLYSSSSRNASQIIEGTNFEKLNDCCFNKTLKTLFLIHGWLGNMEQKIYTDVKETLLEHHDANFIGVDWRDGASQFYSFSKNEIASVGQISSDFVDYIINRLGYDVKDIKIVGFSLGAHIAGIMARTIKSIHGSVDYVVGLDPAGPLFNEEKDEILLDPSDADYVHVIHTNGGLAGFLPTMGHVDFYPNGGTIQNGCSFLGCSHNRAVHYFTESLVRQSFVGKLCDNMEEFDDGLCENNIEAKMGGFSLDKSVRGRYYLRTAAQSPFGLQ